MSITAVTSLGEIEAAMHRAKVRKLRTLLLCAEEGGIRARYAVKCGGRCQTADCKHHTVTVTTTGVYCDDTCPARKVCAHLGAVVRRRGIKLPVFLAKLLRPEGMVRVKCVVCSGPVFVHKEGSKLSRLYILCPECRKTVDVRRAS